MQIQEGEGKTEIEVKIKKKRILRKEERNIQRNKKSF